MSQSSAGQNSLDWSCILLSALSIPSKILHHQYRYIIFLKVKLYTYIFGNISLPIGNVAAMHYTIVLVHLWPLKKKCQTGENDYFQTWTNLILTCTFSFLSWCTSKPLDARLCTRSFRNSKRVISKSVPLPGLI